MMTSTPEDSIAIGSITPLRADDLGDVVAIDSALSGTSRRGFFEKRLAAALEEPGDFIYVGLRQEKRLVGYALARLVEGEFGKPGARAALDAIGVDPALRGKAAGRRLLAAVEELLRHKGVSELTSQVEWEKRGLLGFFASAGFAMAPRIVLTRPTAQPIS
jgi:ribosomal protein S18 acetylase RimI-like enzyme